MSTSGLTVVGAQVIRTTPETTTADDQSPSSPKCLTVVSSYHSNLSAAAADDNDNPEFDPSVGAKPCSPFYRHADPTASAEHLTLEPKRSSRDWNSMRQMESGICRSHGQSLDVPKREGGQKLWCGDKKKRVLFKSLTPKQRLAVKIAIAVVIVGTMVAIALGITAAVGGGVWKPNNQQGKLGAS